MTLHSTMYDHPKPDYWEATKQLTNGGVIGGPSDGPISNYELKDGVVAPTDAQVKSKLIELLAEYDSLLYQRERKNKYPNMSDVIVALAEKTEGDSTMWDEITAKRAAIKTKWPKDNSGPLE